MYILLFPAAVVFGFGLIVKLRDSVSGLLRFEKDLGQVCSACRVTAEWKWHESLAEFPTSTNHSALWTSMVTIKEAAWVRTLSSETPSALGSIQSFLPC